MTCQYLIGICSKTRLPCPHCRVDGKCDEAQCVNAAIPTWEDLFNIYVAAVQPTVSRMNNVRGALKRYVESLGCTLADKVGLTDDEVDAVHAKLMRVYSPFTVQSIYQNILACSGRNRAVQKEYRNRSKIAPTFDFPGVKNHHLEPPCLTTEQRVMLKQKLAILRSSNRESDHRKYIWAWFAWRTGMRPSDICRIKWSVISVQSNGTVWVDYVPHKTGKSTGGRKAGGRISEEAYEEIKPFIRDDIEFVITRHDNRKPKSGCVKDKHGQNAALHASLRKWCVSLVRSLGVKDRKPAYVLRKDCAAMITASEGPLHGAQMLGDNLNTYLKHYVNFHKTELKSGL